MVINAEKLLTAKGAKEELQRVACRTLTASIGPRYLRCDLQVFLAKSPAERSLDEAPSCAWLV